VRVVVRHRSRYHYPRPALLGPQLIRLRLAQGRGCRPERGRRNGACADGRRQGLTAISTVLKAAARPRLLLAESVSSNSRG